MILMRQIIENNFDNVIGQSLILWIIIITTSININLAVVYASATALVIVRFEEFVLTPMEFILMYRSLGTK